MARILELAQLAQHHRMPQVQIRSGGIDAQLHPQGTICCGQALRQGSRPSRKDLGHPPLNNLGYQRIPVRWRN
jgi:hypothetical protein